MNRKFLLVELPGYSDSYTEQLKEALDLKQSKLKLHLVTVHGVIVATRNLLLQVTSDCKYEIAGIVIQTMRFKSLADYYHEYPQDCVELLRNSMLKLNFDQVLKYKPEPFGPILGPPSFTKPNWQLDYHFKENPTLQVIQTEDPTTGEQSIEFSSMYSKHVPGNAISIGFTDKSPLQPFLPDLPSADDSTRLGRISVFKDKLSVLFERRPIWTRLALANELNCDISNHYLFYALPYIAYMFQQGPWRQCWVKYGIDPRKEMKYRIYQIIDLRMTLEDTKAKSHIYDGITYTANKIFQLCDITAPAMEKMIYSISHCRPTCQHKEGWYLEGHLDLIRDAMKEGLKSLRPNVAIEHDDAIEESFESTEEVKMSDPLQKLLQGMDDEDYFELLEMD